MGRKPLPIETHVARGTYRPDHHGPIDPAKRVTSQPLERDPPKHLNEWAREEWNRLYELVTQGGLLTENERTVFAAYCVMAGKFNEATHNLNFEGAFARHKSDGDGHRAGEASDTPSKWHRIQCDVFDKLMKGAAALGLTAIDRSRVVRADAPKRAASESRPRTSLDKLGPIKLKTTG